MINTNRAESERLLRPVSDPAITLAERMLAAMQQHPEQVEELRQKLAAGGGYNELSREAATIALARWDAAPAQKGS